MVDLLELARLDDTPPQRAPLDLLDLVRGAVGDRPGVCIDGAGPVPVTGDATALGRVVTNLVDNASRHAHTAVQVHVGADGDRARLDVRDDGPGVAADDRERIFERFARLDAARARDEGGTGLGLAIVRVVVTQHAGTVTAIARPDGLRGACLRVELPLSPPPGARR